MKAGQEAVMQRCLMSAQKLRRRPSVMTSRPPSRTTRGFGVRSLWLLIILLESPGRQGDLIAGAIMA
jgi:hypothetical protein